MVAQASRGQSVEVISSACASGLVAAEEKRRYHIRLVHPINEGRTKIERAHRCTQVRPRSGCRRLQRTQPEHEVPALVVSWVTGNAVTWRILRGRRACAVHGPLVLKIMARFAGPPNPLLWPPPPRNEREADNSSIHLQTTTTATTLLSGRVGGDRGNVLCSRC